MATVIQPIFSCMCYKQLSLAHSTRKSIQTHNNQFSHAHRNNGDNAARTEIMNTATTVRTPRQRRSMRTKTNGPMPHRNNSDNASLTHLCCTPYPRASIPGGLAAQGASSPASISWSLRYCKAHPASSKQSQIEAEPTPCSQKRRTMRSPPLIPDSGALCGIVTSMTFIMQLFLIYRPLSTTSPAATSAIESSASKDPAASPQQRIPRWAVGSPSQA